MPSFERAWNEAKLSDENLKDLEIYLCEDPNAGDMIQGTGGLRKLRWAIPGKGKSSGIRTLYIDFASFGQIFMVVCFRKSNKDNLNNAEKKSIKTIIKKIKDNLQQGG